MTVGFVSSASGAATGASATVALVMPGASAGNLLIAWATEASSTATFTANLGLGAPQYVSTNALTPTVAVWIHTLVSGDLGQTVTFTANNATHKPAVGLLVLSGAASVDAEAPANSKGTTVDCASTTPTHDHDAVVTIGVIDSATTRTWTGWSGSVAGPTGGTGSLGTGGVEFAAFYNLDIGATSGTPTGVLTQITTPSNNWAAVTLAIAPTGGPSTVLAAAALSTQSILTASAAGPAAPNLMYAKSNGTWGTLVPFNASAGSIWN
jgi:hypothetical protein